MKQLILMSFMTFLIFLSNEIHAQQSNTSNVYDTSVVSGDSVNESVNIKQIEIDTIADLSQAIDELKEVIKQTPKDRNPMSWILWAIALLVLIINISIYIIQTKIFKIFNNGNSRIRDKRG